MATQATVLIRSEQEQVALVERFNELADRWKAETAVYSASWQIKAHPAYREIAAMGTSVISLLLDRLDKPCVQWLMALCAITGDDPSPEAHAGILSHMAEDWREWGRARGYWNGTPD